MISRFQFLVTEELHRARLAHPERQASLHEGYAVLLEEVEEFWTQVMLKASKRDPQNVLEELVQIAAMAQRTAEDLGYVAQP